VHGWRRRVLFVLLAYTAILVLWASRPWSDTRALVTPPDPTGAPGPTVFGTYDCPPLFSRAPEAPTVRDGSPYPPSGTPCGAQGGRRVLFFADLAVVAVAIVVLQRSGVRHQAAAELDRVGAGPGVEGERPIGP